MRKVDLVTALKNAMRYKLLTEQFKMDANCLVPQELKQSIARFFTYIYEQTDLYYIDSIDEDILKGYIQYYSDVNFYQCVKDIKGLLYFLEHIKGIKHPPKIDLSLKNLTLWRNL